MAISAAVAAELAAILQSQRDSGCASWYMSLLRAADRAMAEAREDDSTALKSPGYACSMMLEPRAAPGPFRPILQMETGRSALPEDFDENVVGLFREAAASSTNPEFRARLLDVIWLRGRDPAAARDAIEAYFAAAESDILEYPHDRLSSPRALKPPQAVAPPRAIVILFPAMETVDSRMASMAFARG